MTTTSKAISEFMGRETHKEWAPETFISLFLPPHPLLLILFPLTAEICPRSHTWRAPCGPPILFISASATHTGLHLSPNSKFSGEIIRLVQHESGVFPGCQGMVSESVVLFNGEETSQTCPAY